MSNQFEDFDSSTHLERINKIKQLAKKDYLDSGPVALYHLLHSGRERGWNLIVEVSLRELEKLYGIEK